MLPGVISPSAGIMLNEMDRLELAKLESVQGPVPHQNMERSVADLLQEVLFLARIRRHCSRMCCHARFRADCLSTSNPPPREKQQQRAFRNHIDDDGGSMYKGRRSPYKDGRTYRTKHSQNDHHQA
ncbi:hypothetical protein BCR43DRAFT_519346 [Syncephalastrum racemosum]|uniref:Uncharacterized protein n=1 Tax=Syncephalastrum racemosum TaxID=13706 RepID=A0A1X2GZF0_SYNRA|nr:hypothetical protein BCR43DRAFT_519346 [Syncephalastrum racemosum]